MLTSSISTHQTCVLLASALCRITCVWQGVLYCAVTPAVYDPVAVHNHLCGTVYMHTEFVFILCETVNMSTEYGCTLCGTVYMSTEYGCTLCGTVYMYTEYGCTLCGTVHIYTEYDITALCVIVYMYTEYNMAVLYVRPYTCILNIIWLCFMLDRIHVYWI